MSDGWWHERLLHNREVIRSLDHEILEMIDKRMKACVEVGEIKVHLNKHVFDPEQEKRVLEDKAKIGAALGLEEDFVKDLMILIMDYSKRLQSQRGTFAEKENQHFTEKNGELVTR